MKRHAGFIALAGIITVAITSCSRVFFVEPIGSLESGVRFEFRESPDGGRSKHRIREFVVYQESDGSVGAPVWSLEGSAKVHTVTYGKSPKGLSEVAPASPLEANAVYYVMARDKPIFNSIPGYASTFFAVSRSGEVHACLREKCAEVARMAAARTPPNPYEAPSRQQLNCSPPAATSGRGFFSLFSGPRSVFASLVGAASAGPCTQHLSRITPDRIAIRAGRLVASAS